MEDLEKKIAWIQAEIRRTPYHKGTEHYVGLLRAKLAKLKSQLEEKSAKKGGGASFAIPKTGDATCVLVGLPSVGKSTLLAKLTSAKPKIAPYPFTTLTVIPGIMNYSGAKIQILDVPGLVGGAAKGVGAGREVLSIVRIADLLIIIAESFEFEIQKDQILAELARNGIRVNKSKPKISVKKLNSGGIKVTTIPNCSLEKFQINLIAKELGLVNAEIQIKEEITTNDLIDAILGNRVYKPAIFVASKIDLSHPQLHGEVVLVSALQNVGLTRLKEKIWEKLKLIRVFLKPPDAEPDLERPLILKYRSNILEAAKKISGELAQNLKFAQIIRGNLKKQVGAKFQLEDGDIVTLSV